MARAATTTDAFNAIAEPRRRQILDALAGGELRVNDLVAVLGVAQPQVSKHLKVLREVGLVEVREEGRERIYRAMGRPLKPIHDWVKNYEGMWSERFDALDDVLEELKAKEEEEVTMISSGTAKLTLPSDTQISITREFAAPKHLVYKALTTPELVKRWWHANRGEVKSAEIDLRPGGKWRYVSTAGSGMEVGFHGEYREIVPNERLVSTEVFEGAPDPEDNATVNTVTLTEQDGRTSMTVLIDCPSAETRNAIIESGMEAGMQDAYDLLEELAVSLS